MISVTVSTYRFNNVNPFSLALLNYNHTPPAEHRKIPNIENFHEPISHGEEKREDSGRELESVMNTFCYISC